VALGEGLSNVAMRAELERQMRQVGIRHLAVANDHGYRE
jgi:hypothetical protein